MTTLLNACNTSDLDTAQFHPVKTSDKRSDSIVLLTGHYIQNKQIESLNRYHIRSNNGKDYSITDIPIPHPFFEYKFWGLKQQRTDYNCTRFTVYHSAWARQSHILIRELELLFKLIFNNNNNNDEDTNKYMGCEHAPWMSDIDNYLIKSLKEQKEYKVKIDDAVNFLKSFKELLDYRYIKLFVWHLEIDYLCQANLQNIEAGGYFLLSDLLKLSGAEIIEVYDIITTVPFNLCIRSYKQLHELNLEHFDMATKDRIGGSENHNNKRTREDEFHRRVVELYDIIKESTWTEGQCAIDKYIAMPDADGYDDALKFLVQNKIVVMRKDDIILPIIDFWEQSICESLRELFFSTIKRMFFFCPPPPFSKKF